MPVSLENRAAFFKDNLDAFIRKYRIAEDPYSQLIDWQRFAYLCSTIVIKMYGSTYGPDSYTWFFNWAQSKKIRCSRLDEEKYDANGHLLHGPWPSSCKRFFEHIGFSKYSNIAEKLLFPEYEPLLKREPLCSWK